jgi:hypothetical protein
MHPPPHLLLHRRQLRLQPVAPGLPPEQKPAAPRFATNEGEAQEGEGFRLAQPARLASGRRMAAKFDQAGLLRMQRQLKRLQSCTHLVEEPTGVGLVLEADHDVIGGRMIMSPVACRCRQRLAQRSKT